MPDTDQKPEFRTGQAWLDNLTDAQKAILKAFVDNKKTTEVEPFIATIKVYANAKATLVFPERVVYALGGNTNFQQPTGLDSLETARGRALDKTVTPPSPHFDIQDPGDFINLEQLKQPRGGKHITIPVKKYTWNGRTNNEKVTLRYPSWMTILAIRWSLWNCLKDKRPAGFYTPGKKRFYPIVEITDDMFVTADKND